MAQHLPGCCGTLSVASLAPSCPDIGTVTRRSFKPQGIVFSPCSKCSQGFPPLSGSRPSFLVGHSTFPDPALLLSPTSLGLLERGMGSLHPSPFKNCGNSSCGLSREFLFFSKSGRHHLLLETALIPNRGAPLSPWLAAPGPHGQHHVLRTRVLGIGLGGGWYHQGAQSSVFRAGVHEMQKQNKTKQKFYLKQ